MLTSYSHLQAASYDKTQLRTFRQDSTLSLMLRCRARRTASITINTLSIIIDHNSTYSHRYVIHSIAIFLTLQAMCIRTLWTFKIAAESFNPTVPVWQLPILCGATSSWQGQVGPSRLAMRPGPQIGRPGCHRIQCSFILEANFLRNSLAILAPFFRWPLPCMTIGFHWRCGRKSLPATTFGAGAWLEVWKGQFDCVKTPLN